MAEQGRPARAVRIPARFSDSGALEETGGRSQGRQQPTGNSSRKRTADSLASHAISLSESDLEDDDDSFQQESEQESDSGSLSDWELSSKGTAKPNSKKSGKPVRVVKTKAAVAKSKGIAR
jgi:hypothetical protein